jgi:hypothetical protein
MLLLAARAGEEQLRREELERDQLKVLRSRTEERVQASGRAGGCHRVGAWTLGTLILCHTITLRPSKMPVRSSGHSSSRMASNVAPPRTGSWTSANGLAFSTAVRTSRRQFFDPKYPLDTKIWMTCEPSMYSSRASMETRSCAGAAPERASVASQEQLCQLGVRAADRRTSTSRKMETPGSNSVSCRLMVAH